jgi:hypothetical protein
VIVLGEDFDESSFLARLRTDDPGRAIGGGGVTASALA